MYYFQYAVMATNNAIMDTGNWIMAINQIMNINLIIVVNYGYS